ncbi:hypothetical protein CALCODRAFT_489564 [Calocera cornea HHB12733]|uniref:Uncharacterized protein n=1 Tax=Calocera cornea HHB12733 TaxID=1353952 RepID=A0A165K2I4_9BASI|nr:hypothetical protein CALCODRAFT_489564 [Calocera cornea HHB12733]
MRLAWQQLALHGASLPLHLAQRVTMGLRPTAPPSCPLPAHTHENVRRRGMTIPSVFTCVHAAPLETAPALS